MSPISPEGREFSITGPLSDEHMEGLGRMIDSYLNSIQEDLAADDLSRSPAQIAAQAARNARGKEESLSANARELQAHYSGAHYRPAGSRRAR